MLYLCMLSDADFYQRTSLLEQHPGSESHIPVDDLEDDTFLKEISNP